MFFHDNRCADDKYAAAQRVVVATMHMLGEISNQADAMRLASDNAEQLADLMYGVSIGGIPLVV